MRDVTTRVGVDDRATPKIRRASREVTRYGRAWRGAASMATRSMRMAERGTARLSRGISKLTRRLKFMMIGFQITAVIMGIQMVRSALKYERALRNVTSLMAGAGMGQVKIEKNFRSMDAAIRRMAVRLGQAPEDLAAGMYNVVSATFDGATGLQVLEGAAMGALAGLSDTNTVTGLLTKTLQAYRRENESNADVAGRTMDVMDTYFMAVNRGMFTFDDLASKMGALPSTAAAFGVGLQDIAAFLSTATIRGMSLEEAIVGVRQAMLQIGKLTPATEKAAEEIFGADWRDMWDARALAEHGLFGMMERLTANLPYVSSAVMDTAQTIENEGGDAMKYLAEATGTNIEAIAALFPNIRALKAVLAISGPGMQLYAENMGYMGERAGATQRALAEMEKSGSLSLQKFRSVWKVIGLDFGGMFLPALTEAGNSIVEWYGQLPQEFAAAQGLSLGEMMTQYGFFEGKQLFADEAQKIWDEATPGERLSFTLQTAWATALTNLRNWFESGGGREQITDIGASLGKIIRGALEALGGISSASAKDSIWYQMGTAFIGGIKAAFEDFDWTGFFQSTVGKALSAVIGGIFFGPGGAIGGYVGAEEGNPVVGIATGAALWAGGKWALGKVGAGAAGGAAGAAGAGAAGAAGGGILARFLGPVANLIVRVAPVLAAVSALAGGMAWLTETAMDAALEKQRQGMAADREAAFTAAVNGMATKFGFTPEDAEDVLTNIPNLTTTGVPGQPLYGFGSDYAAFRQGGAGVDWSAWSNQMDMSGWFGGGGEAGPSGLSEAAKEQRESAADYQRAVDRFGTWVTRLPYMDVVGLGAGGGGGSTGPGTTGLRQALGSTGTVSKPTLFLAGEAGAEDYSFAPRRGGGGAGGGSTSVVLEAGAIVVQESSDARQTAAYIVRELEKAAQNG